jgi:hypothetical protein
VIQLNFIIHIVEIIRFYLYRIQSLQNENEKVTHQARDWKKKLTSEEGIGRYQAEVMKAVQELDGALFDRAMVIANKEEARKTKTREYSDDEIELPTADLASESSEEESNIPDKSQPQQPQQAPAIATSSEIRQRLRDCRGGQASQLSRDRGERPASSRIRAIAIEQREGRGRVKEVAVLSSVRGRQVRWKMRLRGFG